MHHVFLTIPIAAVIFAGAWTIRSHNKQGVQEPATLTRLERRPDLGVDYAKVAKFKLASRKTKYRLGEMISLDLAMLNTANTLVFFDRLVQPNFYCRGRRGDRVQIMPYLIGEIPPRTDSYVLLQPGEMTMKSFEVLAGCDRNAFEDLTKSLNEVDNRNQFEENRFVNWGRFCLKITSPGTYAISAEQVNSDVVVSPRKPDAKTAVGVIRSAPFTIQITR